MSIEDIKLRTKTFPPLTTKGSKLTNSEGDDQIIELYKLAAGNLAVGQITQVGIVGELVPVTSGQPKLLIVNTDEYKISDFDIDEVDEFEFTIMNMTNDEIEVEEGTNIDLHDFGSVYIKPDKTMTFTWIGGKAVLKSDDKYFYLTYDQFITQITAKRLVPCSKICLVDFETIYDQPDYEDDGMGNIVPKATIVTKTLTGEKIVLFATSNETVATQVWSIDNPKDYIEYDHTIDETYVNAAPCKGKITFRRDENGNESNGDTKILCKRYDRGGDENYVWYYDSGSDGFDDAIPIFGADCKGNTIEKTHYSYWAIHIFPFDVENIILGIENEGNNFGFGCYSFTIGRTNQFNNFGKNSYDCIYGDYNKHNSLGNEQQNLIIGDYAFNNSSLVNAVTGDLRAATHIYGNYTCEIYRDATDGLKLRYINGGVPQYANITD